MPPDPGGVPAYHRADFRSPPVQPARLGPGVGTPAGAPVEFEAFVREHTTSLLRSAYLLTRSMPSAEDLVQDTLLRLFDRWAKVQAADVPLAYVRRALVNGFLNDRRRPVRRETVVDAVPEGARLLSGPGALDASYAFPDQLADRDQLWALLGELPDRQRASIVLRFFHDLPDDEIAAHLGARVGTVRSLISRGLSALRDRLPENPS